jgi:2-dehydropantoate 2-reductase
VLGAGGVGGLIAAALARAGQDVVLLMRPDGLARHPGRLQIESAVLGSFTVPVRAAADLDEVVEVLWVTTKATGLQESLAAATPAMVGNALVVPLLNGLDHVERLRRRYPQISAGADPTRRFDRA